MIYFNFFDNELK